MAWLFSFLYSFFAFVLILLPLVVFHEFGHFLFAKLFGVKVEIFSVGFGKKLWSWQKGETEFRLAAIPMGGFVKLLGEDYEAELSEEDKKRALHHQKPWKRFLIFFGGPLFNFILSILLFMVILAVGEPHPASVIGRVVQDSQAEQAGLRSGDRILKVENQSVRTFEQVHQWMSERPQQHLHLELLHFGETKPVTLSVMTATRLGYSAYGELASLGELEGVFVFSRGKDLGISDPGSSAGRSGLETGDQVLQINEFPVADWEKLEFYYQALPEWVDFHLKVQKKRTQEIVTVILHKPSRLQSMAEALGLHSSELFIEKVLEGSPAEQVGMVAGDRVVSVAGRPVRSFFELKQRVQQYGEKQGKFSLGWEHAGKVITVEIEPKKNAKRDSIISKSTQYTIGVIPRLVFSDPEMVIDQIWNPWKLIWEASSRMVSFSWKNLVSLQKMLMGTVSVGHLGGPISIGKIAGESLGKGLVAMLSHMAIFSIGIGVLNVLPVPVLDGGHLLLLVIEIFRGKPLSLRQMEIVQTLGLVVILGLMGIAFSNDLARLFYS
jgi:regulator of sigma E protease